MLTSWVLPALTALLAALLLTSLADVLVFSGPAAAPRESCRWCAVVTIAVCGAGALLVLLWLALSPGAVSLEWPIGLPGAASGMVLALDPLSACFLLLLFVAAAPAVLAAWGDATPARACLPVFLAAMALTLLAGDSFTVLLGFEAMSLASCLLVLTDRDAADAPAAAVFYLGMSLCSAACLIGAFALLLPVPLHPEGLMELRFAAIRAAPPSGWHAPAVLVLALLGAGAKAGVVPLHVWLPRAHAVAPAHVSALMSGVMTKVAVYLLIRIVLDLCGPAQPVWWGVPLLATGAASAVLGGLRATQERELKSVLAASTIEHVGLIVTGLGVALIARGSDLPLLAALALAGALLHVLTHGVFKTLLFLGAGAVDHAAGSRRFAHLGGLIHRMPVTAVCLLAGAAALAALPPGPGFASEWVLFQSLLAAAHSGGVALQTLLAVAAASLALAAGLAVAAAVRLVGMALLGRPRTARCAAAHEAARPELAAMLALTGLLALMGLLPGLVLQFLDPAVRQLAAAGLGPRAGVFAIATQTGAPGYAAPGIVLLLGLALLAVVLAARRLTVPGARRAAAWDGGFAAPPASLPFGDPSTQYGAASFAQPLGRMLGTALLRRQERSERPPPASPLPAQHVLTQQDPAERWLFGPVLALRERLSAIADGMQLLTIRRTLSVMFALLVLLLAIVAWVEA